MLYGCNGEPPTDRHEPLNKFHEGGSPQANFSSNSSSEWLPSDVKRRKRLYSRCISGIEYASAYGKISRFVTLTTKVKPSIPIEIQIQNIRHYWDIFVKRIKHQFHCRLQYIKVIAKGDDKDMIHIHSITNNSGYLPQDKLSSIWHEITGDSFIVDIRIVDTHRVSKRKLAGYLPGYLQQSVSRYSRSKDWLPSKYLQVWNELKKMHLTMLELLEAWNYVLRSHAPSPWLSFHHYFQRKPPSEQKLLE